MISLSIKKISVFLYAFLIFSQGYPLYGGTLDEFTPLTGLIGKQDSMIVEDASGKTLFSKNADNRLIPASILKILTSLAAIHYLGADYRFITEFYMDDHFDLKIKGYGDPMLISEVVSEISKALAPFIPQVHDVITDSSAFSYQIEIPGVTDSFEPYDAPNGALCVNFNTVNFKKNASGEFVSAEPQTPLLSVVQSRIRQSRLRTGRVILSQLNHEHTLYSGHLFRYFLENSGVKVSGTVRVGKINPQNDRLLFRYVSKSPLTELIESLLKYSNNFTANQLLITIGMQSYGEPGDLTKGVKAIDHYAKSILDIKNIDICEGSGISVKNRISGTDMMKILRAFEPYHHLMRREDKDIYKTGTLNGVRTRAGYIDNGEKGWYRYAIMINSPGKGYTTIMKKLIDAIEK